MAKRTTALENTAAAKTRADMAAKLEKERLQLTKEMEKLMKKYAKATGLRKLGKRVKKVGKAPNDFKA